MGDYRVQSTNKAELIDSGTTLVAGDRVKDEGEVSYEILRFEGDGYVVFEFIGESSPEIVQGEEGSDLLSVWDSKFKKGEYEKVT